MTLADLHDIAARHGWIDVAADDPTQGLWIYPQELRTSVVHVYPHDNRLVARIVSRRREADHRRGKEEYADDLYPARRLEGGWEDAIAALQHRSPVLENK